MKALLIAGMLLFSTAAIAQDMGQAPSSQPMQSETTPAAPDAGMSPPTDGAMTPPPAGGDMAPSSGGMDQPGAPAPAASAPGGMPMAGAPAAGDPSTYPTCSRKVTDRCVNRGKR